jgi:hypothetical protein
MSVKLAIMEQMIKEPTSLEHSMQSKTVVEQSAAYKIKVSLISKRQQVTEAEHLSSLRRAQ